MNWFSVWFDHTLGTGRMTRIQDQERVPDWLLGGKVRRRVLRGLNEGSWKASELASEINAGRATVFEIYRALKPLEALEETSPGAFRLGDSPVAEAIRLLLDASIPFDGSLVDRPPGRLHTKRSEE